MARIRDIRPALRAIGLWTLTKRIGQQTVEDHLTAWAAALAYSWLLALFPFLVFLMSLPPLLPDRIKPNIKDDVSDLVDRVMAPEASAPVKQSINNLIDTPSKSLLTFGLVLTIYAASKGMSMTMTAIDKAYDVEKGRPFWKQQPLAFILTIVVASMVVAVLILLPVGTGVLKWMKNQDLIFPGVRLAVNVARYFIGIVLMFMVLSIIYHYGPSFKQRIVLVTPGALFCIFVWMLLGLAFKYYLTKLGGAANYTRTYGAVAGAAILLLFFYLDALVLLIGAEINSEIDFALGRAPHKK
jgi:membrane protein